MANVNWERWARATGIVFVVLAVIGFLVIGDQPKVGDSSTDIASFYTDHRSRVLTAIVIFGFAFLALIWFVGAVANTLREAGEGRLAATALVLSAVWVALQASITMVAGGLALNIAAAGDNGGVLVALNTLTWTGDVFAAFLLAGIFAATTIGLVRARVMPSWYGWLGLVAALATILRATNWARDGFWSPSGDWVFVAIVAGLVWTLVTSILLVRRAPATEGAPERAAVPTT
jgi:hypothetical protein